MDGKTFSGLPVKHFAPEYKPPQEVVENSYQLAPAVKFNGFLEFLFCFKGVTVALRLEFR